MKKTIFLGGDINRGRFLGKGLVFGIIIFLIISLLTPFTMISRGNPDKDIDINSGLIGYWSFDEDSGNITHDNSGFGNNGNISGAMWANGVSGRALELDGSSKVTIPNHSTLNPSNITLACWVKFDRLAYGPGYSGTDSQFLICKGGDRTSGAYYLQQSGHNSTSQNLGFAFGHYQDPTRVYSSYRFYNTSWYHIAGTYNGSTMKLYINGDMVNSKNIGKIIVGNNKPLYFSYNDVGGFPYYLDGIIDDFRIYNRALNENEIKFLYNYPLENNHLSVTEVVVVVTAVAGGTLLIFIGATGLGKYKFLSFLGLLGPLYLRTVKDDVFDNQKRLCMYNHIAENQPVVYTDIKKTCNLSDGEINWHAHIMTQLDIIRMERKGFHLFFYLAKSPRLSPEEFIRLTDLQKSLLDLINKKPGITQAELVEKFGLKQQNISYNLLKLEEKGKIRVEKKGKIRFYHPKEDNYSSM